MKYALGNMLNGAGGLNADGLSLDLKFATDKTLTARKGPTPTFTRASTATFVGSDGLIQSAAINAARFDHDPVTLACKGLLIEESRTNQILQSENFGTTWALVNATTSLNAATAPDGSTNADKIINTSGGVQGRAQQSFALSGSNVYSVFAKASEWGWVHIAPLQSLGGVWFDLTNGTIGTQNPGFVGSITSFGNGWYRCVVQFTGISNPLTARIHPTNANTVFTLGDGTSGVFVWGAQLEAGSFPTSYIPTTTASVVRSVDICSISGANFTSFYNNAAGTFVSESMIANLTGNTRGIAQIDSGTGADNVIRHNYSLSDGGFNTLLRANLDTPTVLSATTGAVSTIQKRATAYAGTSFASTTNGGAVATVTRTFPVGLNTMKIGSLTSGWFVLTGHIAAIKFYKKRLANAKLIAITT
jgi:hypothetical protein